MAWIAGVTAMGVSASAVPTAGRREPVPVTVMSRNLYLGADIYPAIGALIVAPEAVPFVLAQIWDQVRSTDATARMRSIADEIEVALPDLVGVQEAAVWRTQSPADHGAPDASRARDIEIDLLGDLLLELRRRGLDYRVAAAATGSDVERSQFRSESGTLLDTRLTVRDAVLYRRGAVRVSRRRGDNFDAAFVLPFTDGAVPLLRSWVSVDARVRGRRFRFISVHIEDPAVHPEAGPFVNGLQAREILDGPARTERPVILVGDFNTDPDAGYAPATRPILTAAGFEDAWAALHPGTPGPTWDAGNALLTNETFTPDLRLDYVFTRGGARARALARVGTGPDERAGMLWRSDHAGLVAVVEVE